MASPHVYDDIGRGYATTRQADPRIAAAIRRALGDVRTVLNVGAGVGSYEPADVRVIAVEPSLEMIRQRPRGAAPAVQAMAERLPFRDQSFDATLAVLTIHHWRDRDLGLQELRRVSRERTVVLTWDPAAHDAFWLTAHYLPEIVRFDLGRFPAMDVFARHFTDVRMQPLLIPHDCRDGFLGAFWRRPEAYLSPAVRRGISGFAQLPAHVVDAGLRRLADDLQSGDWNVRFGPVQAAAEADLGYRLVVARSERTTGSFETRRPNAER
jgi:SAM-dependent methyltransferase